MMFDGTLHCKRSTDHSKCCELRDAAAERADEHHRVLLIGFLGEYWHFVCDTGANAQVCITCMCIQL